MSNQSSNIGGKAENSRTQTPKNKRNPSRWFHDLQEEYQKMPTSEKIENIPPTQKTTSKTENPSKAQINAETTPNCDDQPKRSERPPQDPDSLRKLLSDSKDEGAVKYQGFDIDDFNSIPYNYVNWNDATKDCVPEATEMVLQPCYYSEKIKEKVPPLKLGRISDNSLALLFYLNTQNEFHINLSIELFRRNWRYHKQQQIWIAGITPETQKLIGNQPTESFSALFEYIAPNDMSKQEKEFYITCDTLEYINYSDLLKNKGPSTAGEAALASLREMLKR